ncbi:MAG: CadD family cadmium resistance transporter [Oscillospiraceae bacterium]|jgi:cadmium resistance transport/sequestration family protein|nr:CadD family cadmium resistance transporter [Oscillospiraceae bacterium]MCI2035460.1 CadD family cadmium resistance transporter [Oscillospiraceae bacterium]
MALILSAAATFVSTSIDYLVILIILYSQKKNRPHSGKILAGQYLGLSILILVSLVAAFAVHLIPQDWIVGFLGLVPLFLGIRAAVRPESGGEEDEVLSSSRKYVSPVVSVAVLTLACGGDNLGIYIPYFTTLRPLEIGAVLGIFAVLTFFLNFIGKKISDLKSVGKTIEKQERILVPAVFIALGVYIMVENGTVAHFFPG